LFEKEKANFYKEYELDFCRMHKSNKPEAVHQIETINRLNKWFTSKEFPSGSIVAYLLVVGKLLLQLDFFVRMF
jgi:hypothetical protein